MPLFGGNGASDEEDEVPPSELEGRRQRSFMNHWEKQMKALSGLNPLTRLSSLQDKIAAVKQRIGTVGLVSLFATAFIIVSFKKTSANIQVLVEKQKATLRKNEKLRQVRENVAGPLLVAARDLKERLQSVLLPPTTVDRADGNRVIPTDNYLLCNFNEKPETVLVSTMYLFCSYIYFQYRMEDTLKYENITRSDGWQSAVDNCVGLLQEAWQDRSTCVYEGEPFDIPPTAQYNAAAHLPPHSIIRRDMEETQRRQLKYPFRLLPLEFVAIGEIMRRDDPNGGLDERSHLGWRYTEFVPRLKTALQARHKQAQQGQREVVGMDTSVDEWVVYMLPLWDSLVRYNVLIQDQEHRARERVAGRRVKAAPIHERYLVRTQYRLRNLKLALLKLCAVLNTPKEVHRRLGPERQSTLMELLDGTIISHNPARARRNWALLRDNMADLKTLKAIDLAQQPDAPLASTGFRVRRKWRRLSSGLRRVVSLPTLRGKNFLSSGDLTTP